jgi:hypothetical protein
MYFDIHSEYEKKRMKEISTLLTINPLDGRYRTRTGLSFSSFIVVMLLC